MSEGLRERIAQTAYLAAFPNGAASWPNVEDHWLSVADAILSLLDESEPVEDDAIIAWQEAEYAYTSQHVGDQYGLVKAGRRLANLLASPTPTPDPEGGEG